jgi:hypothetical protein
MGTPLTFILPDFSDVRTLSQGGIQPIMGIGTGQRFLSGSVNLQKLQK